MLNHLYQVPLVERLRWNTSRTWETKLHIDLLTSGNTNYVILPSEFIKWSHFHEGLGGPVTQQQSHMRDTSCCWWPHLHPCETEVLISVFCGWKKSILFFANGQDRLIICYYPKWFLCDMPKVLCLLGTWFDLGEPGPVFDSCTFSSSELRWLCLLSACDGRWDVPPRLDYLRFRPPLS